MKPPYSITANIIRLVALISEKIGEINAHHLYKPATELRKKNRIKTIQSSLEIEGNTLTEEQITDLSTFGGNGIYFLHVINAQNNTVEIRKIVLQ